MEREIIAELEKLFENKILKSTTIEDGSQDYIISGKGFPAGVEVYVKMESSASISFMIVNSGSSAAGADDLAFSNNEDWGWND